MNWKHLSLACLLCVTLTGCAGAGHSAGEYMDDATITAKVKTKLFDDPQTGGFAISVKTHQGTVQLSGFVDSDKEKDRAGELAKAVAGVKTVKNDLVVKTK